eukprot:jgi/Botrbrau1/10191/Bobra.116_1s0007.1
MSTNKALSKFLLSTGSFAAGGLYFLLAEEYGTGKERALRRESLRKAGYHHLCFFNVSYCSAAEVEPEDEVEPWSSNSPSSSSHVIRIDPTTGKPYILDLESPGDVFKLKNITFVVLKSLFLQGALVLNQYLDSVRIAEEQAMAEGTELEEWPPFPLTDLTWRARLHAPYMVLRELLIKYVRARLAEMLNDRGMVRLTWKLTKGISSSVRRKWARLGTGARPCHLKCNHCVPG